MEPRFPDATEDHGVPATRTFDDRVFVDATSPLVRANERIIAGIAATDIPILLVGESGSGKEVVAQRIHRLSSRRHEPFLKLVCTTLVPKALELLPRENEGSDVVQSLFIAGTVFLDEIGDLDQVCQARLLHMLPEDEVNRDGHLLRARVISSCARNLEEEIRIGRFREELYYRLNGVCLRLPPLRHRKQDIPGFVDFFLTKYSTQFGRPKPSFSSKTLSELVNYSWPGNIRQLENVVKKAVALGDERLALAELEGMRLGPQTHNETAERFSLKDAARAASRHAERELILKTLEHTRWNRKRAAKQLQISYKALLYKLKQIGTEDSSEALSPDGERR